MASHHCHFHNYGHHHYQTDSLTTHCCCGVDYNPGKQQYCCPPPPPSFPIDQLLQTISSYLLQSNPNPTLFQTQISENHCHYLCDHDRKYPLKQRPYHEKDQATLSVISSLLHRVEALKFSLRRHQNQNYGLDSLRDAAARVIQTHVRAFLVHRSRTLSQPKDLAFIKSTLSSLKSSISRDPQVSFGAMSHKAMDLLLQMDSIRGDDPMGCDGKRSITRELIRFLDLIDGIVAKRHGVSVKTVKNMRSTYNLNKTENLGESVGLDSEQSKMFQNLRKRVKRISMLTELSENDGEAVGFEGAVDVDEQTNALGHRKNCVSLVENGVQDRRHEVKPKVKKCVTFQENGNRLHRSREQAIGSESSEDMGELVKRLTDEAVEAIGTSQGSEVDDEETGGSRELW